MKGCGSSAAQLQVWQAGSSFPGILQAVERHEPFPHLPSAPHLHLLWGQEGAVPGFKATYGADSHCRKSKGLHGEPTEQEEEGAGGG